MIEYRSVIGHKEVISSNSNWEEVLIKALSVNVKMSKSICSP